MTTKAAKPQVAGRAEVADRKREGRGDAVLVAALAAGATRADAAKAAGISEGTVYERLRDPAFRRRVDDARADLIQQATGRALDMVTKALTTLGELLDSPNDPTRLSAARAILDTALRLRETADTEARLTALEESLANQAAPGKGGHRWSA